MLKVLQLVYNWGLGGYENYLTNLVEKLHNKECKFYLAYSERLPMPELVKSLGIETFEIPMKSPYDVSAARKVKKLCKDLSIDAVQTHFIRERYIAAMSGLLGNKARLIYTSHVVVPKSSVLRLTNRIVSSFEDKIIAISYAGRDQMLEEGLNPKKIKVIHHGVDISYWAEKAQSTIRNELGIGEDEFLIATTGRFSPEKGHSFLIEAVRQFKDSAGSLADKCKFLIAGDGELLEDCKDLAKKIGVSDIVIFTGFRTDIRNILQGSNLYVSPSKEEALGISIIEAIATGLPVISTDVGGTSEVINEENGCGILVRYGDTTGLADCILKLIKDAGEYGRLKENALRTSREKFNLDNTIRETYNLYKG